MPSSYRLLCLFCNSFLSRLWDVGAQECLATRRMSCYKLPKGEVLLLEELWCGLWSLFLFSLFLIEINNKKSI